jgi:hypothetical protein
MEIREMGSAYLSIFSLKDEPKGEDTETPF